MVLTRSKFETQQQESNFAKWRDATAFSENDTSFDQTHCRAPLAVTES